MNRFIVVLVGFFLGAVLVSSCGHEEPEKPIVPIVEEPVVVDSVPEVQEVSDNNFDELFPLPDSLRASEIDALLLLYRYGTTEQRDSMRNAANDTLMSRRLLHYAYTTAVEGVRLQNAPALLNGVLALSLNNGTGGFRESIRGCALLWYSHQKLDASALPHFQEAIAISTPEFAEILNDFAKRNEDMKDIRNFGYIDINSPDFNYIYYGFSIVPDSSQADSTHAMFLNN